MPLFEMNELWGHRLKAGGAQKKKKNGEKKKVPSRRLLSLPQTSFFSKLHLSLPALLLSRER